MQPETSIRAVVFDFDGTLADTIPLIAAAWNFALQPIFGQTWTIPEIVALFGPTDAQMLRRQLQNHTQNEAEITAVIDNYFAHYEAAHAIAQPFDKINELLEELNERGFILGLMTGKGRRAADITLRELGWQNRFACVITGDESTRPKPAPDGILQVLAALQIAPANAVYIGDLPVDIRAGRTAGCRTIAAGWNAFDADELRQSQPDFWAETPQQIIAILDSIT